MDLYVILRRNGWRTADDLKVAGARSAKVGDEEMSEDIRWIRSYVLDLLVRGDRNADIAAKLFLSEKTVGHHVSAILRKLGVRTRGQAGAEAARLGLVER